MEIILIAHFININMLMNTNVHAIYDGRSWNIQKSALS